MKKPEHLSTKITSNQANDVGSLWIIGNSEEGDKVTVAFIDDEGISNVTYKFENKKWEEVNK